MTVIARPAGFDTSQIRTGFAPVTLDLETRDDSQAGDKITFRGHAAVYNRLSQPLSDGMGGTFRERLAPAAFTNVLDSNPDVRFLLNHNADFVLARTPSTLDLREDPYGLHVFADIAPTQTGRDLKISVTRGDISQMSFAFSVADGGDTWFQDENGNVIRTVTEVDGLYDVSAVTYPAYTQTDANVRCTYSSECNVDTTNSQVIPEVTEEEATEVRNADSELAQLRLRVQIKAISPRR